VIDAATGRVQDATPLPRGAYDVVRWLPSGLIVYTRNVRDHWYDIVVAPSAAGKARTLRKELFDRVAGFSVSADGRRLVITEDVRPMKVNVIELTSGRSWSWTLRQAATTFFSTPDGRIGFVTRSTGRRRVEAVDVDGRGRRTLASLPPGQVAMPMPSPDGRRLAFVTLTRLGYWRHSTIVAFPGRGFPRAAVRTGYGCWFADGVFARVSGDRHFIETKGPAGAQIRVVYHAPANGLIGSFDCR